MRRKLAVALALCLCAPWPSGCGSTGPDSLAELIPSDALIVLSLNWQAVRADGDLLRLVKGGELKKVFGHIAVSEEEVGDISVFGDGSDNPEGSTAMLLSGSFDAQEVVERLGQQGWGETDYGGRGVYRSPSDGARAAALDSDVLVLGTQKGVEGAIRAASGDAEAFSSTDAYKRLSELFDTAEHPVSMMIAFPQQLQDAADAALTISSAVMDLAGVGALGQLMSKIGYSRAVGCTIGREGDSFPVELVAVMKDEEAATLVSGAFTLLKGLGALAGTPRARTAEDAEAIRNFQNMSITRDEEVLSIGLVMSRRSLFAN